MRKLLPLPVIFLLSACGMKGDLYEPSPVPAATTEPAPVAGDTDKGERKTIPSTPNPASAE